MQRRLEKLLVITSVCRAISGDRGISICNWRADTKELGVEPKDCSEYGIWYAIRTYHQTAVDIPYAVFMRLTPLRVEPHLSKPLCPAPAPRRGFSFPKTDTRTLILCIGSRLLRAPPHRGIPTVLLSPLCLSKKPSLGTPQPVPGLSSFAIYLSVKELANDGAIGQSAVFAAARNSEGVMP